MGPEDETGLSRSRLNVVIAHCGASLRPCLQMKAAQSRGVFFFIASEINRVMPQLRVHRGFSGIALTTHRCLQFLVSVYDELILHGPWIPPEIRAKVLNHYVAHVTLFQELGHKSAPKHHLGFEMLSRAGYHGNPRCTAEYKDESYNCVIARIAGSVHRSRFALGVILKYRAYCMSLDRFL